jgi:hypothetical protein
MTAAYQDERITITAEGISVGQQAFTMNLVNHATITVAKHSNKPPWKKLVLSFALTLFSPILAGLTYANGNKEASIVFNCLTFVFAVCVIFFLIRCLWLSTKPVYKLVLNISGNDQGVLSSKDKDYIHMLAGLINTFKGYTPETDPEFDYEGEVLE